MKLKFLHKRKEEKQTEEEAFSLPKFIIERSRAIEIVFLVLVLISALMAPFVEINYDLTGIPAVDRPVQIRDWT